MSDLIDRQAALDALGNVDCSDGVGFRALKYDAINDAVTAIKALPSVTPKQPGWIPCSERCPDKSEWYLVTEEWDDGFTFVTKDRYVVGDGWTYAVFGTKCLAWMPLPTPYREGGQDG